MEERAQLAVAVQQTRDDGDHGHDVARERALLERATASEGSVLTSDEREQVYAAIIRAATVGPATPGGGRCRGARRAGPHRGHSRVTSAGDGTVDNDPVPRRVGQAARIRGELRLPGDKSIAHRALLFDALGVGEADVRIPVPGGDVRSTVGVLAALGALLDEVPEPDGVVRYRVRGGGTAGAACLPGAGGELLDHGNAGTSMRLSMGALAGRVAAARQTGDASLSIRPMERVAVPLRQMGASVSTVDGHAPVTIRGARPLRALHHDLPVASAQVLGAVTLAALAADGRTTITTPGPTRDHTERLLAWLGAPVWRDGFTTTVGGPVGFAARDIDVPGDISSAAFWLAAAALHPDAELRIRGVGLNPSRTAIIDVLREMGADITVEERDPTGAEPVGDLVVRGGAAIHGIRIDGARVRRPHR